MTDNKILNAAQLCRVYAAAGTPILWLPDQLRRYAVLLEQQDRACAKVLDDARAAMAVADARLEQARKIRRGAVLMMLGNVACGAVVAALWLWMMWGAR
jgi:CRISPR/Cas system-associated endonuclease Cas1